MTKKKPQKNKFEISISFIYQYRGNQLHIERCHCFAINPSFTFMKAFAFNLPAPPSSNKTVKLFLNVTNGPLSFTKQHAPVVRVGLFGSRCWKATPLSGIEIWKPILLSVVVAALMHSDVSVRLDLLVAIPVRIISSSNPVKYTKSKCFKPVENFKF